MPVPVLRPAPRDQASEPFATDVIAGLSATPKRLLPKYFYDETGSQLFEDITQLPEYYPTRTELKILRENALAIAGLIPRDAALVEFGAGAATKAKILLEAAPQISAYVPVDISAQFLGGEAAKLERDIPRVAIYPVATDFTKPFESPAAVRGRPCVGFFPGSTIGNFEPHEATDLLRLAAQILGPEALFIIGADLVKDRNVLHAAYNDTSGVTAKFNLNLLARINRELGADFNLAAFEHHACYNQERSRIEVYLASRKRQKVRLLGKTFEFRAGETIHTENSYKFTLKSFSALARGAGWAPVAVYTDADHYFSVNVLTQESVISNR
jgi:dimethylhistidine N-methyltransferase